MTKGQKLRRLQLAIDHIALVLEDPEAWAQAAPELSEALDLLHHAEGAIERASA